MSEKPKTIICRVCLRSDSTISEKCLSLFEKYKTSLISDTINSIALVGIRAGDGLPSKICPDCLLELDTAINFKTKCENSNNLLRTTLLNNGNLFKPDHVPLHEFVIDDIKKEEPSDEHSDDFKELDVFNEKLFVDRLGLTKEDIGRSQIKQEGIIKKSKHSRVECHDCGERFMSKCKLQVHWKRTHMLEKLICDRCKRPFKTVRAYNKHINDKNAPCLLMENMKIEGIGKDRMFYCNECAYKSHRFKDMKRHLNSHTGAQPYQCNICHKSYTQRSSLNSHLEVTHKMFKTEITCQYCGKYLRGRTRVYSHLRMHRQTGLQCDICQKVLRSKRNLILHLQRHKGVKMYTCELCGSSYCTLWKLSNHRRTKHGIGQHTYECNLCDYKSYRTETLNRHKRQHTNNTSNICCLTCGVFVSSTETLEQHQKRHIKKFQCPCCELKYARKNSLQKHIRAKHEFTISSSISKPVVVKTEKCSANLRGSLIEAEVNTEIQIPQRT